MWNENLKNAPVSNKTTTGNEIVAAPGAGKGIRVVSYTLSSDTAGEIVWKSGANALSGSMEVAADSPFSGGPLICNANEALVLDVAAGALNGHVTYYIENNPGGT